MVNSYNLKKIVAFLGCVGISNALTVFHLTNPFDLLQSLSHVKIERTSEIPVSQKTFRFLQEKIGTFSADEKEGAEGLSSITGVNFKSTPLSQEAFKLQSNSLFAEAAEKRKVAKYLQEQSGMTESELKEVEIDPKKNPEKKAAITNMKRAKVLLAQAYILEEEAKRMQLASERSGNNESFKCDILKIGPLAFAPNSEEITDIMDGSLGFLNGNMLTVYYNSVPKASFSLEGIELPIHNVDAAPGCIGFKYHGTEQVVCATGKDSQSAWINAITEAWFCRNLGLAGTLPSVSNDQDEEKSNKDIKLDDEKEEEPKEKKSKVQSKSSRLTRSSVKTFTVELEDGQPKISQS
ncbi:PH domain-like protein [Cryptosporidium felis]|nr:PH domain-like protein [Cryptosporidium felis]